MTLIEALPQIMAPFDPEMAAPLEAELTRHGIKVLTSSAISAFEAPSAGAAGSDVVLTVTGAQSIYQWVTMRGGSEVVLEATGASASELSNRPLPPLGG